MLTQDKTYKEEHRIVLESLNDFSHGFLHGSFYDLAVLPVSFCYEKKFFKNFKQISPATHVFAFS